MSVTEFSAQVQYWDRGIDAVPIMTGAASVMDCSDLVDACARLGLSLPMKGRVLDVGCGTARWKRHCQAYQGLDISPSAVAYAKARGISAHVMEGYGPATIAPLFDVAEWVTCFSVFTHIDAAERLDYLKAFAHMAPSLIVDVIPGDGSGGVALWTADVESFERDLTETGWTVRQVAERVSPDAVCHRYYWCTR